MGQGQLKRIGILIICLLAAGGLVHFQSHGPEAGKNNVLADAMRNVDGWQYAGQSFAMESKIVQALELDDYINYNYRGQNGSLSLYIGYYLTSKKVGAAHDPMVCFPGQGWVLSERSTGKVTLDSGQDQAVNYSSMIAQIGVHKELIVYWFQSYDKTSPDTFKQKVSLLWAKILGKGGDNAFVRISVTLNDISVDRAKEVAFDFIRAFYPQFLNHIVNG